MTKYIANRYQKNIQEYIQKLQEPSQVLQLSKPLNFTKPKKISIKNQFKILIVDDDEFIAETFSEILKIRGHDVTTVCDAMSCIGKCENNKFDLIFMDFHLKDDSSKYDETNGAETTDLLKSVCSVNSIVFAITGDDSKTALSKFKEVGMDGALIKPLDIDIINKLMNCLELRNGVDKRVVKTVGNNQFKKHLFIFE